NADVPPGQFDYDLTVGVDPQNPQLVYIGFQELWLSTNGGTTFGTTAITANQVHWDHHALVFSPRTHWGSSGAPTQIWIGTDGGVATSANGGTTWTNLNTTIATNLFYGIDIGRGSTTNNAYTYGGNQDTGVIQHRPTDSGTQWHLGLDGDGGPVVVIPFNPQQAWGSDDGDYVETTNAGVSWAFPAPPTTGLPGTPTASHSSRAQPLAADANLNGLLYASGQASGTRLDLFQAAHFTTPTPTPIT